MVDDSVFKKGTFPISWAHIESPHSCWALPTVFPSDLECDLDLACFWNSQVENQVLEEGQQDFSVKSQIINLGFVSYMWSLSHLLCFILFCFTTFKSIKTKLSSWGTETQIVGQIWQADSNLLTTALKIPTLLSFSLSLFLCLLSWQ